MVKLTDKRVHNPSTTKHRAKCRPILNSHILPHSPHIYLNYAKQPMGSSTQMEPGSNDILFVYVDEHMLPDKPVLIEYKQYNLKLKLVII